MVIVVDIVVVVEDPVIVFGGSLHLKFVIGTEIKKT